MSITINPVDGERSGIVFLENDSSSPIAIQLTLAKRVMDKFGNESYPEETSDLEAYPTQLIIPAFEKKSVKITFTGKEVGSVERAYRIIAEQLPIEVEKNKKKKMNVKILLRYIAALYIDNGKSEPNILVDNFSVMKNELVFKIKNTGSKHQVLTNLSLLFKKEKEKDILVEAKELKNFSGENILPNSEREFVLPIKSSLSKITNDYKVELKFEKDQ
jgi:fimbrial chaperone protein